MQIMPNRKHNANTAPRETPDLFGEPSRTTDPGHFGDDVPFDLPQAPTPTRPTTAKAAVAQSKTRAKKAAAKADQAPVFDAAPALSETDVSGVSLGVEGPLAAEPEGDPGWRPEAAADASAGPVDDAVWQPVPASSFEP